jgi:hypothetical protein
MDSSILSHKFLLQFRDLTDNSNSDADPEGMPLHISKLCRFATMIGGMEVPEIRVELEKYNAQLPYFSLLEVIRVTVRRLAAEPSPQEFQPLGSLNSVRREGGLGSLQALTLNYSHQAAAAKDPAVIANLLDKAHLIVTQNLAPEPINVCLLLDFIIRKGQELHLDVRDEGEGITEEDDERSILDFFRNRPEEETAGPEPTESTTTGPLEPSSESSVSEDPESDNKPDLPL